MGSWNTRVVRLQKQLNYWGKQLAGKGSTKAQQTLAVSQALARYRSAFKPGSKAMAFWRPAYTFRNGTFMNTYSSGTRKRQAPLGVKGSGYALIPRQGINLSRGLKVAPRGSKDVKQAKTERLSAYNMKTKDLVKSADMPAVKANRRQNMSAINSTLQGEGFRANRVQTARARKASDNTRKGNTTKKTKRAKFIAELKAIKPDRKKPAKKKAKK